MCGNEQAAPWCLVLTGNTTAATESEAATLKFPDVAADVFPTIHPFLKEEAARLPQYTFFPPFLDPAISSLACHPSTVHWPPYRTQLMCHTSIKESTCESAFECLRNLLPPVI